MKLGRLNCFALALFAIMLFKACPAAAQHTVTLNWPKNGSVTLPSGETLTGFKIYRATVSGAEIAPPLTTITDPTAVTFTDSTVVGGTTYFYKYTITASCNSAILDCSSFVSESAMSTEASPAVVPKNAAPALGTPATATVVVN